MKKAQDKHIHTAQSVLLTKDRETLHWRVPEEIPIAIIYNRRNYAVMLATPRDFEDFAIGFSLSEQVVRKRSEIKTIIVQKSSRGIDLHITIASERAERLDIIQRRRNMPGRAGCGLCGLDNIESFFIKLPPVTDKMLSLCNSALQLAEKNLVKNQPLNQETQTVHGAAFASLSGDIVHVREDVGRHNALDKLLGACVAGAIDISAGFVLMSSRCSYEIVEKCAWLGVHAIASLSAPTAFAVRKANEARISLYCRMGEKGYGRVVAALDGDG